MADRAEDSHPVWVSGPQFPRRPPVILSARENVGVYTPTSLENVGVYIPTSLTAGRMCCYQVKLTILLFCKCHNLSAVILGTVIYISTYSYGEVYFDTYS